MASFLSIQEKYKRFIEIKNTKQDLKAIPEYYLFKCLICGLIIPYFISNLSVIGYKENALIKRNEFLDQHAKDFKKNHIQKIHLATIHQLITLRLNREIEYEVFYEETKRRGRTDLINPNRKNK